ncbi:Mbov_0395 family pilin-like conjugal transfer protein [Candidatus Absconditicoccus praedator]|uniref:Mbov_0395 family pilin-like conjugal transfer protein n=1 Tax=Candidatus Absconditicoccus praedator TaxID=2735562 RepID=UPI001E5CEE20|nr:pilin [Candidatus Absconditicoccus praedator]UFX82831.1 hypothetical protein HLG78_01700 [Candidatus Absconditicoccus praedator]
MKKFLFLLILICMLGVSFGRYWFDTDSDTYTRDREDVVGEIEGEALREGADDIGSDLSGVAYEDIEDSEQAQSSTVDYITVIVNYFLGILSLVALVYLLYHGFLMVTAAGDDEKYKKGGAGIKYATIALIGIGVSWFFISLLIYLVEATTGS